MKKDLVKILEGKSREKIIALLSENGKLTAAGLAAEIGVTAKAVEKHLAKLKAEGVPNLNSSVATDDLHPETATLFISYKSVEFLIFQT